MASSEYMSRHQRLLEESLSDAVEALAVKQPLHPVRGLAELLLNGQTPVISGVHVTSKDPVLVDMDNVLCDFDQAVVEGFTALHPGQTMLTQRAETRKHWSIADDVDAPFSSQVKDIYCSPGFVQTLTPIAGAVEALREMLDEGHDVRLCTSPLAR